MTIKPTSRTPAKSQSDQQVTAIVLPTEHQPQQSLFPVAEVELDGVAMGVLSDGTPFLHLRGLARLCGVDHSVIQRLASNWPDERVKPRGVRIVEMLKAQKYEGKQLHLVAMGKFGEILVFTDAVCMAILEYYAFDATQAASETALRNYRILARESLRKYIYQKCKYDPDKHIPEAWRTFHERVLLNDQLPSDYFSVFREMADLVVHMIRAGAKLDSHTVPDISVGQVWSKYWQQQNLAATYGERVKAPHIYPDWFPQSAANPVDVWIYPIGALGVFKQWLHRDYYRLSLPKYTDSKVKQGVMLPARASLLLAAVKRAPLALK